MSSDPLYIPPSDRDPDCLGWLGNCHWDELYERFCRHATFMDERDARQRDLIKRLADIVAKRIGTAALGCGCRCAEYMAQCPYCENQESLKSIVAEARGVEAANE